LPSAPIPRPIRKVLIANRGEIAVRIARACRELGIQTVAVYSDADRAALHVLRCDEAYRLGPSPATESYLRGDLILDIARSAQADAIHPGYGFLSENAAFAQQCRDAGIIFIGPSPEAMRALGSKTAARRLADSVSMPRVPGSSQGLSSDEEAVTVAAQIGYPVMLKASAGGGGKGMRRVDLEADLLPSLHAARSEAERAFGDSEVYVEKLVVNPRHIEIQLLADHHGNCLYLGERECSVQRRHQKVVEEAPSAVVSPDLRRRMGEAAVSLATAAGYTNAGTIEFLLDDNQNFYFLEMNTRLQVEHPVTELVTGLDLVHLQILVAQGRPLPFTQADIHLRGHAIECRIYAEDPDNQFFPSPGRITRLIESSGPGVRLDSGVYEGWTVPLDYDPMLSKLVAYAPTRLAAIETMLRALDETFIAGIATNISLFHRILNDPDFRSARIHTGYLDQLLKDRLSIPGPSQNVPGSGAPDSNSFPEDLILAAVAAAWFSQSTPPSASPDSASTAPASAWKQSALREGLRS
jgi:acetyl-CoA carboxylase biotin carboxylase subunit